MGSKRPTPSYMAPTKSSSAKVRQAATPLAKKPTKATATKQRAPRRQPQSPSTTTMTTTTITTPSDSEVATSATNAGVAVQTPSVTDTTSSTLTLSPCGSDSEASTTNTGVSVAPLIIPTITVTAPPPTTITSRPTPISPRQPSISVSDEKGPTPAGHGISFKEVRPTPIGLGTPVLQTLGELSCFFARRPPIAAKVDSTATLLPIDEKEGKEQGKEQKGEEKEVAAVPPLAKSGNVVVRPASYWLEQGLVTAPKPRRYCAAEEPLLDTIEEEVEKAAEQEERERGGDEEEDTRSHQASGGLPPETVRKVIEKLLGCTFDCILNRIVDVPEDSLVDVLEVVEKCSGGVSQVIIIEVPVERVVEKVVIVEKVVERVIERIM
ncbi:hypothetical protein ABW20_dc0107584 [Dactylellina cionopaga]|nr:hypothetical protein ABW20_dc0107584 [Dactylellina cionopaga]